MANYLHGLHDPGGEWAYGDHPSWIVHSIALTETEWMNFTGWTGEGFRNIVRLNWAHNGVDGTIPSPDQYQDFANRCADFVMNSPGVEWVVIGNEPNHKQEWPKQQKIEPTQYAKCFDLCYQAIRNTGDPVKVMTAGIAPWNQQAGDWLAYYRTMLTYITKLDGFALHAYTHGTSPDLIFSEQKVEGWLWHFRTYQDQLKAITNVAKWPLNLPTFITESDQGDDPWRDANTGWIQNALAEINAWNSHDGMRKVHAVCFYRWTNQPGDIWGIEGKNGVIEDFQIGANIGYTVSEGPTPTPQPPNPEPTPEPPTPTPEPIPEPARDIDPKLIARGVYFDFVEPPPGTKYWRITQAYWLEDAANIVGPDHHILGTVLQNKLEVGGIKLQVDWPSGSDEVTSKPDDPNASYNYDFGMSASLNEFGIHVVEGVPSDYAGGIGMGKNGNPKEHTSTWITFEYVTAAEPIEPIPPLPPHGEIETGIVTASAGLNLRAGPGTSFHVLGTLRHGSTVLYDTEQEGWLHVVDGWASADYVGDKFSYMPPPLPVAPPILIGGLVHPLPGSFITQHFYQDPPSYEQFDLPGHDGTDFGGVVQGTPILAIADGKIFRSDYDAGYGNYIMIFHEQKLCYSLYAHCSELLGLVGKSIRAGEAIGLLGSTGNSSGPHLHFEIRLCNQDGTYREDTPMRHGRVDPETWCIVQGLNL